MVARHPDRGVQATIATAVSVAAMALATPVVLAGLIAVAVYASYAIGERFAALVEAHQEVDGTAQVLGRVSDLLAARTLPRQRITRRGPATATEVMDWLAPASRRDDTAQHD